MEPGGASVAAPRRRASNVIDRHVRDLRAKLDDDPYHPRYIETVAGAGYRFIGPRAAPPRQGQPADS